MTIRDILHAKGATVVTVGPDATILEAMRLLVRHQIGALVVIEADQVRGILSERDVLRVGAEDPVRLGHDRVRDAMTADVLIGVPEDDLDYVKGIMTRNRVRHLPIVVDGALGGIVSIGDVVKACHNSAEAENRYLRDYILGIAG